MKICFVTTEYPLNGDCFGTGYYTYYLSHAFAERGHVVQVVVCGNKEAVLYDNGVTIYVVVPTLNSFFDFFKRKFKIRYFGALYFLMFSKSLARKLFELIRKDGIDVIEFSDGGGIGFFYFFSRFFRRRRKAVPVILKIHSPLFFQQKFNDVRLSFHFELLKRVNNFLNRFTEVFCLKKADFIITPSRFMKKETEKYSRHTDIKVLPNFIDLNFFKANSALESIGKPKQVLCVSNVCYGKGVDLFLEVALSTLKVFPDVEFHLVGKDLPIGAVESSLWRYFEEKYALREFRNNIIFDGYKTHEELKKLYQDADVFAFCSRMESFGLVILEAQAMGVPVIAFKVGGIPEIIKDGETGLLVEPYNVEEFSRKLVDLLRSFDKRKELTEAAKKAVQSFSLSGNMGAIERSYLSFKYE